MATNCFRVYKIGGCIFSKAHNGAIGGLPWGHRGQENSPRSVGPRCVAPADAGFTRKLLYLMLMLLAVSGRLKAQVRVKVGKKIFAAFFKGQKSIRFVLMYLCAFFKLC